jgi:hypothetical protein
MIRVGVIGYGYWGPNVVRNSADAPRAGSTGALSMAESLDERTAESSNADRS